MKIVVLDDYADAMRRVVDLSRLDGHELTIYRDTASGPDAMVERLREADAVMLIQQRSELVATVIEQLPKLRLISQTGKNVAHIDIAACNRMGVVVSGGGQGSPPSVTAELAWGLILSSMRDIPRQVQRMKDGEWLDVMGTTLAGKTLGIYAFGRIGSVVARIGAAFEMKVVCWGGEGSTGRAEAAGFAVAESREAFFAMADVLSLHLPLNADTRGIITAADLAGMKPSALLVNTSRANIIEPGALYAALVAGRPGFAAVDVFEREPVLGANHPLLTLPNALCTPHLGYSAEASYRPLLNVAVDQILAFAAGSPINVINPQP